MKLRALGLLLALGVPSSAVADAPVAPIGMAPVGPGALPVFDPGTGPPTVPVARFFLDKAPVTNAQFLAFVALHPEWQRARISKLFADDHYLAHWDGPLALGARSDPDGPVVRVSWFAARAYCQSRGARLPLENEWELAARASETAALPASDPATEQLILAWYGKPTPTRQPKVMQRKPNFWGIYDLHGLVWEWVHDFNSRVVSDGRRTDEGFVCGGGSLRGADPTKYATFMRLAFRASLGGSFTTADLGFRCAKDAVPPSPRSQP